MVAVALRHELAVSMFDKLKGVEDRFKELERQLSDPKVVQDRDAYQKYIREHAEIASVVEAFRQYKQVDRELDDSLDLLHDDDPEMKQMAGEEVDRLTAEKERLEEELKILLIPKDPLDDKNVILEIRAGTAPAGTRPVCSPATCSRCTSVMRMTADGRWKYSTTIPLVWGGSKRSSPA
jgi:protein subunit release factor A